MKYVSKMFFACVAGTLLVGGSLISQDAIAAEKAKTPHEQGKELTITLCQACHQFEGTNQAGTVGPPIVAMKARFPDRKKLYGIIYDPHVATKSYSMMPPFGRNGLVDDNQIQLIIDFLYTL
ncbi:MAG: sulfur oxidation c-type cytochrome SoxX [Thiogranum sp.]